MTSGRKHFILEGAKKGGQGGGGGGGVGGDFLKEERQIRGEKRNRRGEER